MSQNKYKTVGEGHIKASKRRIVRKTRKVEDSKVYRRASTIVGISLIAATLVVLAVAVTVSILTREKDEGGQKTSRLDRLFAELSNAGDEEKEIVIDEKEVERQAEIQQQLSEVVLKFGNAKSVDEVIPLITDGEDFREEVEKYLELERLYPLEVLRVVESETPNQNYSVLYSSVGGVPRILNIKHDKCLIDWESFAGSNSNRFDQMLVQAQEDQGVVVRGMLSAAGKNEYYNFDYSDKEKWASLKLVFPSSSRSVSCYLEKNSEIFTQLVEALSSEQIVMTKAGYARFVLRLKAKDEKSAQRKQLEIVEILSNSWFLPEHPRIAELNTSEKAIEVSGTND